ncbi:MAG: hypothetical protein NC218_07985 [Acetobacter sp.]|nr:hypothetical protein [Acetobacter sp.]
MTQIKKAFESAAKETAFKNFKAVFCAILKTSAEQILTEEINKMYLPSIKAKEISTLRPKESLNLFLSHIETAMEQLFEEAYRKTYAASYNRSYGFAYKKALESISFQSFRPMEAEFTAEYLNAKGAPAALYTAAEKIFEAFFAQKLLDLLATETPKRKDEEFIKLIDELSDSALNKAMITMLELATATPRALYMASFTKHLITELLTIYKVKKSSEDRLNEVKKQVLSAYITR